MKNYMTSPKDIQQIESNKFSVLPLENKTIKAEDLDPDKQRPQNYNEFIESLFSFTHKRVLEVTFQVTTACDLLCSYCYQHNKHPGRMSLETGKKFIDVVFRDLQNKKLTCILDFIGGEPFIEAKLIKQLVEYWKYKCIMEENWFWGWSYMISISSNGVNYNKPEVQDLLNYIKNKLSLSFSIDGNKELHDSARKFPDGRGSYDIAIKAATDWELVSGNTLGSKITIAPSNLPFLYVAIKHYLNTKPTEIYANTVYENVWNIDYAKEFYTQLKKIADYKIEKYPTRYLSLFDKTFRKVFVEQDGKDETYCGGFSGDGKTPTMLACDYDGVLFPCQRYTEICIPRDKQPPLSIGDVDQGVDFKHIEELGPLTRRAMESETYSYFDGSVNCYECPIGSGCGSCAALCYEVQGLPIRKTNYMCVMHVARALANVYYWNKLYRTYNLEERYKIDIPESWALQIIDKEEWNNLQKLMEEN